MPECQAPLSVQWAISSTAFRGLSRGPKSMRVCQELGSVPGEWQRLPEYLLRAHFLFYCSMHISPLQVSMSQRQPLLLVEAWIIHICFYLRASKPLLCHKIVTPIVYQLGPFTPEKSTLPNVLFSNPAGWTHQSWKWPKCPSWSPV